jgi:mycothiol synthase
LGPELVAEVLALAAAAGDSDGTYPLDEPAVLRLRHGDPAATHLLVRDRDRLVGYAQVDTGDPAGAAVAELVVHPQARRQGVGRALVTALAEVATRHDPGGRLALWAHGNHPAAAAMARALGFSRTRGLLQLRRSLAAPVPAPALPERVVLRAFRPRVDDQAWLEVNARAFADHPEQGRWTGQDLRARMAEPWFDPAGFLLAARAGEGRLLGFHWTKVHGAGMGGKPVGEVYVLGVDPDAHGLGLGRALTLAGLRHLRGRGLGEVMLYVDESNRAALALYTGLGFEPRSVDVTWTRHGHPGG